MDKVIQFMYKSGVKPQEISERLNVSIHFVYKILKIQRVVAYKKDTKNALYNTESYIAFRKKILSRDKQCVKCSFTGSKNNPLQVDHYPYPKSLYPEKIFDPNNARVLCLHCHKQTETYGRSKLNKFAKKKSS